MPGSGLHRQVKVLWRNHRLAVNIWGTGRVHIQGKGAGHFAQLLLNASDISLHSDPQSPQSPVLSESPPVTGSDPPGQAGSSLSSLVAFVIGILFGLSPFWGWHVFCSASVLHDVFRVPFLGSAVSLKACFLCRMVKCLLTNPFLRRWSRFRRKRIRGIGFRPHHGEEQKAAV